MNERHGIHVIRTPEGVEFSQPLAGPVSRFVAWLLDVIIVGGISFAILSAFSMLAGILGLVTGGAELLIPFLILALCSVVIAYPILFEWRRKGQTLGKQAVGIRVIDARGLPLSPVQVVIRNLLRPIDMFPVCYVIGGICTLLTRHEQRLGDLAAGTIVVRVVSGTAATPAVVSAADKYNSLWEHPHVIARLRQAIPPNEAALALQAVLRRERLFPEARVELFQELAVRFKSLTDIPAACCDGISDEQFVRNILQVIYNRKKPAAA